MWRKYQKVAQITRRGFTLVEVAIAVAIAGVGISALVGLQTRVMDTYTNERELTKAVLVAQYAMAFTELDAKDTALGTTQGDLNSLLGKYGYFDGDSTNDDRAYFEDWQYIKSIEKDDLGLGPSIAKLGLPKETEVARRVTLTISWGPKAKEQYTLVYYTRKPAP